MSRDDDHGPAAGCKAYECGVPNDAHNCPFTIAKKPKAHDFDRDPINYCQHEYRQVSTQSPQLDLRFFCVHCLIIVDSEKKILDHN